MGETDPNLTSTGDGDAADAEASLAAGRDTPWAQAAKPETHRMRKLLLSLVAAVILVGLWFLGAAVLPRWWARRVGNVVNESLTAGTLLGVIVGAVFTILPILVLYLAWRFRGGWRRLVAMVVLAALAAAPNLLTLGIVLGSGNAAHAGERILDVDGPGFRGASLVGSVIGGAAGLLLVWFLASGRRNKRKAKRLEAELAARAPE